MKIAIINYGYGNLHSVNQAFKKANNDFDLNAEIEVTNNPNEINKADKIVLPGVGSFTDCLNAIRSIDGIYESLQEQVINKKKYFMGICVGMQLLADIGYENEKNDGFGWVSGTVEKMKVPLDFKIPHMGWNTIQFKNNDLFKDIDENSDFYFVHSYEFKTVDENILATTNYASKVTAAIKKDNIFGTQFHPEKSHKNGQKLIKNFINW
ncbi:imidazole glycerol phosphate synthase subunit HisH [Pelagibacterales bacterium]|jgi:glutamine amidotransferase|nr:imidazole glycerol phosphate synthase subunit HisH [Pelagibacterales bacterium]|tara:strand:- start:387 stop:1013 length:627 start_codon:yes stop_codon:yes gene_type:complete